ncbi:MULTISPECIES: YhcH/YjgK/YiaL family protein [unclassified Saccharicrinis]|uniref:YhcH/YjgK/YiaL family protein n=1 Tax=unclassified Saccharicrinis TaxID=2646859 RepID=UPI003D3467C0
MIVDSLDHVKHYRNLNERIKKAFEFLEELDFENIEPGKYNVEGDEIFAIVSEYNTKEHKDARPEAHERYLDIQYIVKGEEYMGYSPLEDQDIMQPYNVEKDVVFYQADVSPIKVSEGMFALFYPNDIHAPGMKIGESKPVKKVVVKVAV